MPILVIISRDGYEDYIPLMSMEGGEVEEVVAERICRGSMMMTNEYRGYEILEGLGYRHETVKCSIGKYDRGEVYVNRYENRASLLRPWLSKHREASRGELETYIKAFKAYRRLASKPTEELINREQ